MFKVKYKNVKTDFPSDTRISKIENAVNKDKNVTFEVIIDDKNIYEFEDTILMILSIRDDTENISALVVGNNTIETENLFKSIRLQEKYRINGNITTDIDFVYEGLLELVKDDKKIKKEMLKNKLLLVRAIQKNRIRSMRRNVG